MVYLEKVNDKNFDQVLVIKVSEEQKHYVAPNTISMAEAWLNYDQARPFAICNDGEVVGFVMLSWCEDERVAGIWRFMIGTDYQNKGYGRKAMEETIQLIKDSNLFDMIQLDYVEGNTVARELYYSFGFRENGEVDDGEIIMTLPLTDQPQVATVVVKEEGLEEYRKAVKAEQEKGADIPAALLDQELVEKAIREKNLKMYLLMGKKIGFELGELKYMNHEADA